MDDPHERARFERRRSGLVEGLPTFVPTVEKDRDDVRDILIHQRLQLDWPYIERWCREHGTVELLEDFKQQAAETLNESNST